MILKASYVKVAQNLSNVVVRSYYLSTQEPLSQCQSERRRSFSAVEVESWISYLSEILWARKRLPFCMKFQFGTQNRSK